MKIPQELMETIANAKPEWLWNQFCLLEGEIKDYDKIYKRVRYGIKIKDFEIFDLWRQESKAIIAKSKKREVIINGNIYKLTDYWTEEQERISLMRQTLYENLTDKSPLVSR